MLRRLTSHQFMNWVYMEELEPFTEVRDDYRFASIVQALWNIARDPKKSKPFPLSDFVLPFGDDIKATEETKQSWQEKKSIAMVIAAAFNRLKH